MKRVVLCTVLSAVLSATQIGAARAGLSATATISTSSSSAPYGYTINLHNTGDTNISTFWFAWTAPSYPTEYHFLPSAATPTSSPSNWYAYTQSGFPGYSLEFYDYSGGIYGIQPGQTGVFQFTSNDSPAALSGTSILNFPIMKSAIYAGYPESAVPVYLTASAVPEPSGAVLGAIAIFAGFICRFGDRKRGR